VADRYVVPISFEITDGESDDDPRPAIATIMRDGDRGVLYDALYDQRFNDRLLADHLEGRTILGQAGTVVFQPVVAPHSVDGLEVSSLDETATVSSVRESADGETYVHFGSALTVKVFRSVEPGINPDVELRRFLTERTGFVNLSEVLGSSEYQSGDACTFGVLERTLSSDTDAFEELSGLCSKWLSATSKSDEPVWPSANRWATADHAPPAWIVEGLGRTFERVDQLGRLTARLHQSLGSLSEDPELRPVPFTTLYQQSLYQSLRGNVRNELAYLRRVVSHMGSDVQEVMNDVMSAENEMLARLDLIRRETMTGQRIRVHGDFRLDAVATTEGDFMITDLTGDHTLPLGERRLRASPLRDVAQMLRSLDYVAGSAGLDRKEPAWARAAWWSELACARYVESYLKEMAGSPLVPDEPAHMDLLLGAYALARGLRELRWELENRPTWVAVPLFGVRRLLNQARRD